MSPILAAALALSSLSFFAYVVVAVPLMTTQQFQIDARRLFLNAILSSIFMILAFAHIYRIDGLSGGSEAGAIEFAYFSAVTFSTLGFGDFSPEGSIGRVAAALQAMIGNLHLAVIVGALFLRMSRRTPRNVT